MKKSRLVLPLVAFALVLAAGCHPGAKVASDLDPAGTYTLVSVNGQRVPATIDHEGTPLVVRKGTFVIRADGTCTSVVDFRLPTGAEAAREVKATYTRNGATLTMSWEGAGTNTGTLSGNGFTMENEGMLFSYRRTGAPAD